MKMVYTRLADYDVAPDFSLIISLNNYTFPYKSISVFFDDNPSTESTLRPTRFLPEVSLEGKAFQCTMHSIDEACSASAPRYSSPFLA